MDEFELITSIAPTSYGQSSLQRGIGDDAAVFRTKEDIVTAVDTLVKGVHFSDETMDAFHIGYRALAANISDIAAMGAMPKFYLVSITIPDGISDTYIKDIFSGMADMANQYKMDLIGGDTVSGQQLCISITIIGFVETGKARYRNEAKEEDIVFVTGSLGDSRAGLHLLLEDVFVENHSYFINRHRRPEPRVSFARRLLPLERMACNDISDGIANELGEIALASDVDIIIDEAAIPVNPYFRQFSHTNQFEWKLFGGEDFELTGTVAKEHWPVLQKEAELLDLRITKIGMVIPKKGSSPIVYLNHSNRLTRLDRDGYIHLRM